MNYFPAIPLPFYNGLIWIWKGWFICECRQKFWREKSYQLHWLAVHGLRKAIERGDILSKARRKDIKELDKLRGIEYDT